MSSDLSIATCETSTIPDAPRWIVEGGFAFIIFVIIIMFWGISFVCEEYSVPAIILFCKRNKIDDHITGSIFIGTGLSLPVFFVSLIGLFVSKSAIGVGAVVGGNAFNHLITIPSSIFVSPHKTMKLDGFVFTRELLCYFFSCLLLIWATEHRHLISALRNLWNRKQWENCLVIPWFNSFVLLLGYISYCLLNIYFNNIVDFLFFLSKKLQDCTHYNFPNIIPKRVKTSNFAHILEIKANFNLLELSQHDSDNPCDTQPQVLSQTNHISDHDIEIPQPPEITPHNPTIIDEPDYLSTRVVGSIYGGMDAVIQRKLFSFPKTFWFQLLFIITFPLKVLIYWTIPDVRKPRHKNKAMLSILSCIIWLGIQTYILTVALTLLSYWLRINGAILGLTVAAWASNFPAHWSSVIVAKEDTSSTAGDIASCNVFGSNIFNNFIGLGLPWILYSLFSQSSYNALQDQGVVLSLVLLMGIIIIHYIAAALCNFTHSSWMIPFMLITYFAYIGYMCYFIFQL